MSSKEFLDADELKDLTDYKRPGEQEQWLKEHGMPYLRDGSRVIVSRYHVRECLAGRTVVSSGDIDWSAINASNAH